MKKIIISLFVLALATLSANAQSSPWYVGGNVGISATASNSAAVNWNISPDGGYILKDNMLVGVGISFGGAANNSGLGSNNFTFSVQPYYRWKFWGINSLNFWLEGRFAVGSLSENSKFELDGIHKATCTRGSWGIAAAPIMSYEINSQWSIITKLASIGVYGYGKGTYKVDGVAQYKTNGSTYFSLMAINGPSIGVEYRF